MSDQLYFQSHIFVCTNERPPGHRRGCCAEKEAVGLRDYMKVRAKELALRDIRVNTAGCLDRCELGPCMVIYPEGVWYRYESTRDIDEILECHIRDRQSVERLKLHPEQGPKKK